MGSQGFWNPRILRFFVCLSKNYILLEYCSKEGGGGWLATQSTPSGSAPWLFILGRSIFQVDKTSYSVQFRPTWFWCKTCGPLLVFPTNWRHFSQLTALEMLFFEGSGRPDGPYKNLSEQINDKLSPHMHCVDAGARTQATLAGDKCSLATAPSLPPLPGLPYR